MKGNPKTNVQANAQPQVEVAIYKALDALKAWENDSENKRVKAVVKTKLQEALLWAGQLMNTNF